MNKSLLRLLAVLLLAVGGLLHVAPARAAGITCTSASMTAVSFGTVSPLSSLATTTATLTYSCSNTDNKTHSATICFSIGEPGGAQTSPRQMSSGGNKLNFQLYQDPGYTQVWGSEMFGTFRTPLMVNLTLAKGASTNGASATLYAQILNGQTTAVAGSYTDNYQNGDTAITINDRQSSTAPGSCGGSQINEYFPFLVSATVQKNCTVSANNLTFNAVAAGAATAPGNTTMSIACTVNTPYTVGLQPLNVASTSGAGTMKGGTGGNTNTVQYQLYSNSTLSQVWGNTATMGSTGNGVAGSGTGSAQNLSVYAKTTSSTDVTPDTYTDTVQINVNY
jgi:spore coat protein U-like protein